MRGPANSPPKAGSIRHPRPVNSPPLATGTEPLGEAELPLTNNFIWQEENSSIRISLLWLML
jgi:hypothetical protein